MPVKHEIRFQSITRPEVSKYLDRRAGETIRPEELEREQAALEFLGLLPHGFDLRKIMLDLMTEQAAAFYDYDKKALFLTDWAQPGLRDTAVVHELAHALADQNFHLGRYERRVADSSEKSTARQAVIEGQASYLMLVFAGGTADPGLHPSVSSFDSAVAPTHGEYPIFDRAPLYIRMSLIFPYTWGLAFQSALVDRLGKLGYTAPFRHAPANTREILHPDTYFNDEKPQSCAVPHAPRGYRVILDGDLGELDHRVLIQQFVSLEEAKRVSPEWRSGCFRLVQGKKDQSRMLLYASEWSGPETATTFLATYRKCLEAKSKDFRLDKQTVDVVSGHNDRGYFRVTRLGSRIESIEGSPVPL